MNSSTNENKRSEQENPYVEKIKTKLMKQILK